MINVAIIKRWWLNQTSRISITKRMMVRLQWHISQSPKKLWLNQDFKDHHHQRYDGYHNKAYHYQKDKDKPQIFQISPSPKAWWLDHNFNGHQKNDRKYQFSIIFHHQKDDDHHQKMMIRLIINGLSSIGW